MAVALAMLHHYAHSSWWCGGSHSVALHCLYMLCASSGRNRESALEATEYKNGYHIYLWKDDSMIPLGRGVNA